MLKIVLRRAGVGELEDIADIEAACFSEPWEGSSLKRAICGRGCFSFVAYDNSEALGYICGSVIFDELCIERVAVYAKNRGNGIGRRLLGTAVEEAKKLGAETAYLEVREPNAPARGLYKSFGFEDIGIRKGYYSNGDNAVVMQMEI